jgi:hypothetical protein
VTSGAAARPGSGSGGRRRSLRSRSFVNANDGLLGIALERPNAAVVSTVTSCLSSRRYRVMAVHRLDPVDGIGGNG